MFLIKNEFWETKKTKEKGDGIFSKKIIKAGTIIGDYLGKVIKTAEYNLNNDKAGLYLMYFSDYASIYPDLLKPGVHLLNHSCEPNCWIYIHRGHTLFFALRNINVGEELTISYLLSPNEGDCVACTHICKCENKNCTGTMHLSKNKYQTWQSFLKKKRKNTRRTSFTIGNNLKPLKHYPEINTTDPVYETMGIS